MTILIEVNNVKRKISAVEARQNLGDVLSGVHYRNDEVVIERAGKPVAAVIPMRIYERILRQRGAMEALIKKAQDGNLEISEEEAEREAVEAVREYRREVDAETALKRVKPAS
jgi:prevent-host-death family protein